MCYPEAAILVGASKRQVDLPKINREIQGVRESWLDIDNILGGLEAYTQMQGCAYTQE